MSGLTEKLSELASNRRMIKGWYGFVILFFVLLVIVPTIFVLSYVFTDWNGIQGVMGDPVTSKLVWDAVVFSFELAAVVVVIDILAGLPMAWIMVRRKFRGKAILDTLIDLPLAVPTAALGLSTALFWATSVHGERPFGALPFVSSPVIIMILLHIVFTYPYMVRSLAAILEEIDTTYETAGETLGASKFTAVRTITLPLFRAGLVTGIILCLARSLSETGGTMIALSVIDSTLMTGPVLIGTWKSAGGMVPAMAFVSILLIILSLILLAALKITVVKLKLPMKRVYRKVEKRLSTAYAAGFKNTSAMAFLILFVTLPSFFIMAYAAQPVTGAVNWGEFGGSIGYSFALAAVVTGIDLAMGIPLAIIITRSENKKVAAVLDTLVNVPLVVPTAALGFSLGLFWADVNIGSFMLLVFAHVAFTYPLVVRNVAGAIEGVDPALEETARTLGEKPFGVYKRILYPLTKASILAGAIMAFTRSLGETGATQAVVSSAQTAPVYIVKLVKADNLYAAALACIVLIGVSFVAIISMRFITKKEGGRG
ncbi:MAG: ABC transporter permease subunit [Methanobacteriota archaeon]